MRVTNRREIQTSNNQDTLSDNHLYDLFNFEESMFTDKEIHDALSRFSYRPGWSFIYYRGAYEGPHITIIAEVENSYNPGEYIPLEIESAIPPMRYAEELYDWLLWRICRIEVHEAMEWAKVEGTPWVDPHRPHADRDLHRVETL